jgi:hypothetical protein
VVSYVWGQKHYPIPYNLNKIYAFILSMAVFYIIYEVARYQNGSVGMALRIVLLLLFGGVVYGIERYKWVKAQ